MLIESNFESLAMNINEVESPLKLQDKVWIEEKNWPKELHANDYVSATMNINSSIFHLLSMHL
jgi:hypothetical protein